MRGSGGDGPSTTEVRRQGGRPWPSRRSGGWGIKAKRKYPSVRRESVGTREVERGTVEGEGWGECQRMTNQDITNFRVQDCWGDLPSTWTPPAPSPTSKYYQRHSHRSDSPGAGAPGWAESGAISQALDGYLRMREFSKGSLSRTVAGNLGTERRRRGGRGRGDREREDKGSGGGSRQFSRIKEGI